MKKIALLIVFMLIFSISCAKRTQNSEVSSEQEAVITENTPVASESPVQATTLQTTTEAGIAKDALTAQVPVQETTVTEKPTAENIQQALKNAGLYNGNVDGKIGPKTKKSIEEFQKANGLKADGKVGPKTWEKLKTYLKASAESFPVEKMKQ